MCMFQPCCRAISPLNEEYAQPPVQAPLVGAGLQGIVHHSPRQRFASADMGPVLRLSRAVGRPKCWAELGEVGWGGGSSTLPSRGFVEGPEGGGGVQVPGSWCRSIVKAVETA